MKIVHKEDVGKINKDQEQSKEGGISAGGHLDFTDAQSTTRTHTHTHKEVTGYCDTSKSSPRSTLDAPGLQTRAN